MSALTCPNGHAGQTPEDGQFCPQCGVHLTAAPAAKTPKRIVEGIEVAVVMGLLGLFSYYALTRWLSHPLSLSLALFIALGIIVWATYWEKHRGRALVVLGALALFSTGVFFITESTGFNMPWGIGLALLFVGLVNRLIGFVQQR